MRIYYLDLILKSPPISPITHNTSVVIMACPGSCNSVFKTRGVKIYDLASESTKIMKKQLYAIPNQVKKPC